ncbi:hypothetical protein C8Q76DRAFT_596729, partial [Earliella scabrosa]
SDIQSLMRLQSVALKELQQTSSRGADVAVDMKHAEFAIKDLIVAVKLSNLTIKDTLSQELSAFVAEARLVGRGLQHLAAKVNGVVDGISAANAYAAQKLQTQKAAIRDEHDQHDLVSNVIDVSFAAFSPRLRRIMLDATSSLASLEDLEERLSTIHELCHQESFLTTITLDNLLWELWTVLGGNQQQVRDLRHRTNVLRDVDRYRSVAAGYVGAVVQALTSLDAELLELHDRILPGNVEITMPVEIHLTGIHSALSRLAMRRGR